MKKTLAVSMVMVMALVCVTPFAQAATSVQGPFTVSAVVPSALTLTVVLKKNDFAGAVITSMNFGNLVDIGTGTLRSTATGSTTTGAVATFLSASSQGLPYSITQTGTPMSNGASTLPAGACIVKPVYAAGDNGGLTMPAGASLGTGGTWTSVSPKLIYQSEAGVAQGRTIAAFYSVTDDPSAGASAGVPTSQAAGTYSGTVTFTLTA